MSAAYDLVERINAEVNRSTTYASDLDLHGVPEFWTAAAGAGDCEDYALAKRQKLLAAGFPLEALRLAVVFTETPRGRELELLKRAGNPWITGDHAVLIATVPEGDYILDNRHPVPMDLASTGYDIDRLQIAGTTEWEHGVKK